MGFRWVGDCSGEHRCGILGQGGLSSYRAVYNMPTAIKSLRNVRRNYPSYDPGGVEVEGIPGKTILWVFLFGYFDRRPTFVKCRLFHRNQRIAKLHAEPCTVIPGYSESHGPSEVWNRLTDLNDQTFSAYQVRLPASDKITLAQGIESAKNHIRVCSDPRAREISRQAYEICSRIGGRVQIATIAPSEGFQWVPGFEPAQAGEICT